MFDDAFLKPYPNVKRYYVTLVNQPQFKAVMGEPTLCETPLKFTRQSITGCHTKITVCHVAPKKKGESKPKAEKPEKEKSEDKPEEEKPKKEKEKTWLDLLPPTTMPLDAFKRLYSNCPQDEFRKTFVSKFWDGGDIPKSPTDEVLPLLFYFTKP